MLILMLIQAGHWIKGRYNAAHTNEQCTFDNRAFGMHLLFSGFFFNLTNSRPFQLGIKVLFCCAFLDRHEHHISIFLNSIAMLLSSYDPGSLQIYYFYSN